MIGNGYFRWVVSGLLAVLASLLTVIAGLVLWIFRDLTARVDELERQTAKNKIRLRLLESTDRERY